MGEINMDKKNIKVRDLQPVEFIELHSDSSGFYKEVIYTDGDVTSIGGKEKKEKIFEYHDYFETHYLNVYKVENASYITKVRYEGRWAINQLASSFERELISAEVFVSDKKDKKLWRTIKSSIYDANEKAERLTKLPISMSLLRNKAASFDNLNKDSNIKIGNVSSM